MKRIIGGILAFAVLLTSVFAGFVLPAAAEVPDNITKVYYDDFEAGLSETATATGNGDNTDYVMAVDGAVYSVSGGALHLQLTNGNYLRIQNTMTDTDSYKYMVVRMRGSSDWGAGLTGNSLAFWFGSWGTPGARLYMTAEQLTSSYTDVIFEIPKGYFDGIVNDYKASLFITTERGASFDVYIEEIYFYNENEEPEEPEQSNKYIYNDFEAGLGGTYETSTPTGNGDFVSYAVNAEGGAGWSVADGVLHLDITNGQWLRTWNNINGLESYKYMVVKMKGSYDWGGTELTGNSISFKFGSAGSQTTVLSATAEQLTEDYSYAYIEIPNPSTFYSAVTAENYRYSLWIGTQRGAQFSVDIDEIFFTNDEPGSSTEPEEPGEPVEEDKLLYIDFNSGLGDSYDTRTPTGNTGNEAYAVSAEGGAVWSVDNGALNLKVTNGQWLRTWNTITGLDDYRYMVLRMKGSYDWGGTELTGNALSFKFGSAGSQTAVLSMSADKLTEDYSDVVIDIPDNFFTAAADNGYRYSIWIGTERGASFDVYIDEIYFTNTAASEETPDDESFIDVPINKSNVKFLGRTGGSDASNRLVLEWLNSGFSFNFTGSAFEFNVAGTQQDSRLQPYVAYSVDGGELNYIKVVSSSSQNIRVSGLSEGNHSVKIIRTNEPIGNPIYVSDLKISSALQTASVGAPDTASDMKILFIGDSLTTAYGNTGSGNHPYTTDEQDGTKGYAYLTAEHFGADAQYVAREGRGLVNNNYDGYTDYANDMFGVESYVLGTDYDFGSWTPGLVVINLGSNDEQGKPNKTTQTEMHNAVKAFLSRVRGLYPNADIIWAYDTLATSDGGNVKSGIVSAIQEFNDAKVRFCSLSTITGLGTYGHPNVDEHRTLANDLIYYIENPSETTLPGTSEVVYSEFTEQLVLGSSVSNGAGGSIELFGLQDGASQDVKNGALDLSLSGPDAYIRFRSSVILSDGTNSKYKYMGIRIKGGAVRSDGTAVTGNMINVIFASWGNEGNPVVITGNRVSGSEYTDIILALSDANFANSHPDYLSGLILRNAGNFNTSVQIDRIYFTNEKPEDSGTDDPETPVTPTPAQGNADHVYSEFTTPLVEGTAVDNGADGTITLFAIDGGTQTVSGGSLNLKLNGEGSYIRFTSSLALSDGTNSKYKYMVIRMKGGAARADGSAVTGNLLNVIFASWGNEANPSVISGSQVSKDNFTTIVLSLSDKNFANSHPDYLSGLILRNAGNFNTSVQIDRIYFTDEKPTGSDISDASSSGKNTETGEKAVFSDFSAPLKEGQASDNGAGGTITFFNAEGVTQTVSNGALNLKFSTQGAYIRFNSSLDLVTDANTSRYKYMVLRLKGSAARADGSAVTGNLLKVIMCSWGNENNPLMIDASQVTDKYSTIVLALSDKNFASSHPDYRGGIILQSAGNFKINLDIDEIYFTDEMPRGALAPGKGAVADDSSGDKATEDENGDDGESAEITDKNDTDKVSAKSNSGKGVFNPAFLLLGIFGVFFISFTAAAMTIMAKRGLAK